MDNVVSVLLSLSWKQGRIEKRNDNVIFGHTDSNDKNRSKNVNLCEMAIERRHSFALNFARVATKFIDAGCKNCLPVITGRPWLKLQMVLKIAINIFFTKRLRKNKK